MSKKDRIDNPRRLVEYKSEDLLAAMRLETGQIGADIGSGTGLFTLEIAKRVPDGKVFAVDVNREYMDYLNEKISNGHIKNIETLHADDLDDKIHDLSLDFIFICAVLHEIEDRQAFLTRYRKKLKVDAKVYIVEFMGPRRFLSDDPNAKRVFMKKEETEGYLIKSGYSDVTTKVINELVYLTSAKNNI